MTPASQPGSCKRRAINHSIAIAITIGIDLRLALKCFESGAPALQVELGGSESSAGAQVRSRARAQDARAHLSMSLARPVEPTARAPPLGRPPNWPPGA